ncbi:MAG: radical SAM protein, partial [Clostridia bacterium]|nr:radical SAM protein [Clostridia bacterium]
AGRPDTITRDKVASAVERGVTRMSVNTQTLSDEVLASIGRRHTADDFFRAYDTVRAYPVDVNVDLIAGLPGESSESFCSSVDRVASLRPENVTVHTFCVKRSAELKKMNVYDPSGEDAVLSVDSSRSRLIECGYIPYYMYRQKNAVANLENVGYSLPGHEGIYNVLMMEELQSIFALGASAVSKFVGRDPETGETLIKRIAENKYPFEYLREKRDRPADVRDTVVCAAEEFFAKR